MHGAMAAVLPFNLLFAGTGCRRNFCTTTPRRKVSRRSASVTAQIELKSPPFSLNSLEPYMSQQTLEHHWGKHYRSHVEGLNRQILGTELDGAPLEAIVVATYNRGYILPGFSDAAQIWNHDFFWHSMKPGGGGRPSGNLLELIERDFGSFELLLKEFKKAAASQFGSGWVWLTYKANKLDVANAVNPFPSEEDNKLVVAKTPNAVNPLVWDYSPLLAIDLWEHAYYLDYENRRMDYVTTFLEKLVSWEVVGSRLEVAMARTAERARKDSMEMEEEESDYDSEEDESDHEEESDYDSEEKETDNNGSKEEESNYNGNEEETDNEGSEEEESDYDGSEKEEISPDSKVDDSEAE